MTESGELHHKVDKILRKVESIDNFMPWLVRPNSKQLKEELLNFFKKKKRTAKVYLSIDGTRNVNQIAEVTSLAQPNVSIEISVLANKGLIESIIINGNTIYKKNKIDKVLGLSFELDKLIPLKTDIPINDTQEKVEDEDDPERDFNSIKDTPIN